MGNHKGLRAFVVLPSLVVTGALLAWLFRLTAVRRDPILAGSTWQFVFANDGHGKDMAGKRGTLLEAIRRGSPVRIGWSEASRKEGWSVEEFTDAGFTNIMGGREVVAQLAPGWIQSDYLDATKAGLRSPLLEWHAIMSTDGRFEAVMVERETGRTIRKLVQRTRMNWYVFAPPLSDDRRESIVPGPEQLNELVENTKYDSGSSRQNQGHAGPSTRRKDLAPVGEGLLVGPAEGELRSVSHEDQHVTAHPGLDFLDEVQVDDGAAVDPAEPARPGAARQSLRLSDGA
jgi:hypothetical protein